MTQEEFTHIASKMRANAVSVALKCGAAPADAEDIAQDVMLKLWYLHEKMDDVARMMGLVAITTRHVCIDRWRTARTHAEVGSMMPLVDEGSLYAMDERSDRRFAQHLTNRADDETTGAS